MREVKYTLLSPIGNVEEHKHGSMKELLFDLPYLFSKHKRNAVIPLHILNDLLRKGVKDSGMSGGLRWKPFEMKQMEYDELVIELLTEPSYSFFIIETPKSIKTYEKWCSWKMQFEKI